MSNRSFVGVDYKLREVSMAILSHEPDGAIRLSTGSKQVSKGLPTADTLCALGGRTEALIEHLLLVSGVKQAEVAVCMVEEPGGVRSNQIIMAWGIIMAALAGKGFAVVSYPVSSWRKDVLGKGNATKEDSRRHVEESLGFKIEKEDENEAAAIADCASRITS